MHFETLSKVCGIIINAMFNHSEIKGQLEVFHIEIT